ncbi:DUF3027 domain-containing protein [Bifidobacterium sp. MA2]|uniref:DUF3027 domain-containing protein n=1 Tax=Bifidobacterium santillanense TaxID=2809028 RepID=A0ABS5UMY2_9BIFI|nr:DUF3027 domain-containing protein [Bifidobacterium santillanense]MBT1172275.1 DUF3027 domain-containing protein [Bifidobacterium santillanense]
MTDNSETSITDAAEQETRESRVDPRDLARAVAIEVAEEPEQVGDVVDAIDLGDGVTDFRIAAHIRGYEGWQWSVTLYHDEELDHWTVNESSLIPTADALMPPAWVPWKDRLEPTDLAPTDSIGTDPDDPRLEEGFRRTQPAPETKGDDDAEAEHADAAPDATDAGSDEGVEPSDDSDATPAVDSEEDVDEVVEEFDLSRRHVLSPLGRAQTAKRWYEGPRGPKAMSTKTAAGNLCSTCGFFVPLKGELNLMFGVCANKWSPDDGRVVSLDHGCGEHSEIDPPEPSRLWVQSKPAFDDLHIDIIAQRPREDRAQVELLEAQDADEPNDDAETDDIMDVADEHDIEENTEIDADSEDVAENTVPDDGPELETVVALDASADTDDTDDPIDTESPTDEAADETEPKEPVESDDDGQPSDAASPETETGETDGPDTDIDSETE